MQNSGTWNDLFEVLIWTSALIVLLVVLWAVWVWFRKWSLRGVGDNQAKTTWTLQDLREMKEKGELSQNEFETLRQQVLGSHKDTAE